MRPRSRTPTASACATSASRTRRSWTSCWPRRSAASSRRHLTRWASSLTPSSGSSTRSFRPPWWSAARLTTRRPGAPLEAAPPWKKPLVAGLGELLESRAPLAPADRHRVEDEDVQGECAERPERVRRVADEAELSQDVEAPDHDRHPAGPGRAGQQAEARETDHDRPDDHQPSPCAQVEDDDLVGRDRVVVAAD